MFDFEQCFDYSPRLKSSKFIAAGIGLNSSSVMSHLRKNKIRGLTSVIVCSSCGIESGGSECGVKLEPKAWLDRKLSRSDIVFLVSKFSTQDDSNALLEILSVAKQNEVFAFVFSTEGKFHPEIICRFANEKGVFLVENIEHMSVDQNDFIVESINHIIDASLSLDEDFDFVEMADLIMLYPGMAFLAQGQGQTCLSASEKALACCKLDLRKVEGFLINIVADKDPTSEEIDSIDTLFSKALPAGVHVLFGSIDYSELRKDVKVSVFAFGVDVITI